MYATLRACLLLLPLLAALPARADSGVRVPPLPGQRPSTLALKVLSYDGSTNGTITVEVHNQGPTAETFAAQGLFFVPEESPNDAPQRLGAVGPFVVKGKEGRVEQLEVEPGARVVARLEVYCIDSHRHSPTSSTRFHLAAARMPRELSQGISHDANAAAAPYGGVAAPASKGAVQSEVWKNRDKKWIKLEGEGAQERGK